MFARVKISSKQDFELLGQFAACPPCQILVMNNARAVDELLGREVIIKVSMVNLVRPIKKNK